MEEKILTVKRGIVLEKYKSSTPIIFRFYFLWKCNLLFTEITLSTVMLAYFCCVVIAQLVINEDITETM